jgi:hypothetical protein
MKRIKTIALLVTVLLAGRVYAEDLTALIRQCSGNVEIKVPGGEWIPAEVGMTLSGSTLISTGFKSNAVLVIGSSNILVRPLTRLSLEELIIQGGNEQIGLELRVGRVRAEVTPPSAGRTDFTVRGPIATASVRGTSFDFDTINLMVHDGTVAFTGRDNATVFATAGKVVSIDRQGRSADPVSGEEQQLSQTGIGNPGGVALPSTGPVNPVVAGPDGVLTVPGLIGGPGGSVSAVAPVVVPPTTGGATLTPSW